MNPFAVNDEGERPIDIVSYGPGGLAVRRLLAHAMGIETPPVSGMSSLT